MPRKPSNAAVTGVVHPHTTPSKFTEDTAAENTTVTGVSDPHTKVEFRYEINDLHARHKEQFDLYIRAMHNLQHTDQCKSMSYYGIASIHGVPFVRWPFEKSEKKRRDEDHEAGYCTHRSVLFPSWHRVYLLLLEQAVQKEALEIANEFKNTVHEKAYAKAANDLRLPYWDWTVNNSGLPRAVLYEKVVVAFAEKIDGSTEIVFRQINNPLLKYKFPDEKDEKGNLKHTIHQKYYEERENTNPKYDCPWSKKKETLRCPDRKNGSEVEFETQHDVVDSQMYKQHPNLRDMVYKLMTVNEYQPFASTGFKAKTANINNSQSLEGIHDGIHLLCGVDPTPIDGHMGDPMYAAFDPLFWLHHCNVDRIYALWQVLHPGVEVVPQVSDQATIMSDKTKTQDKNTPLYPFHRPDGKAFTSDDVDKWNSTLKFGYAYPETPVGLFEVTKQDELKRHVSQKIIDLLAPDYDSFPDVPRKAVEDSNKRAEVANNAPPGTNEVRDGFQIVTGLDFPKFHLEAKHRREWLANIQIENFAVDGSFFIHIFLGEFTKDEKNWTQDRNLVGTHSVFSSAVGETECKKCLEDNKNHALVSGAVSLSGRLLEKLREDGLNTLEPDIVEPYLEKNLHWRVQNSNGNWIKSKDIASLIVTVTATIVESPKDPSMLPIWGVPKVCDLKYATKSSRMSLEVTNTA